MILNPARWTLRSKLLASIVTLFIVVLTLIGAATVLSMRTSLMKQVDQQLIDVERAVGGGPAGTTELGGPADKDSHRRAPGLGGSVLRLTLDASSTPDSLVVDQNYVSSATGTQLTLSQAQIRSLATADLGTTPKTMDFDGSLGRYRVVRVPKPDGDIAFIGLPLAPIDDNIRALAGNIALMGLLGLVTIGGASFLLVRRNLRPLQQVAATAERVSELPLGRGDVRTDERVPVALTDDHTEVGTVGLALNNLLDHVDSALDVAAALAARTGGAVAVSGEVDAVVATDTPTLRIANGHPIMTKVTGVGCALGAMVAAYLPVARTPHLAAAAATAALTVAADDAAYRASGPGSFAVELLDALARVDAEIRVQAVLGRDAGFHDRLEALGPRRGDGPVAGRRRPLVLRRGQHPQHGQHRSEAGRATPR